MITFLNEMNVTNENYESKDLANSYWTSTAGYGTQVKEAFFGEGYDFIKWEPMGENVGYVRLSKTF